MLTSSKTRNPRPIVIGFALAVVTVALYLPMLWHRFVISVE